MSETRSQLSTYQRVGQIETRVIREPSEEENDAWGSGMVRMDGSWGAIFASGSASSDWA
jgi:hypothetical protein